MRITELINKIERKNRELKDLFIYQDVPFVVGDMIDFLSDLLTYLNTQQSCHSCKHFLEDTAEATTNKILLCKANRAFIDNPELHYKCWEE